MNSKLQPKLPSIDFTSLGPRSLKILCFEDNEGDYILLREYLAEAEFNPSPILVRATTLSEGLELLKGSKSSDLFDVVLLDLSLPDSQGAETLTQVAKAQPFIPITILSGNDDKALAVNMVKFGAQDYLLKDSLNSDLLTRSILYAMERQRNRTQLAALNTRLKKASIELKTTQMQLIQAEKLDSLGRLAAGIAHEVKNPLATLQMGVDYFTMLSEKLDPNGVAMLASMKEAINRADSIVCGMVDYSRLETLSAESYSINQIIKNSLQMVQHEIVRHHLEVELLLEDDLPLVLVDHGKIEQVFINLILNAIQAVAAKPNRPTAPCFCEIEIRSFVSQIQDIDRDPGVRSFEQLRTNDQVVVVEISDCGEGISDDKINRIFEPFYTTKSAGEGTGLGLSVAKNIVGLHRGHLQIKNKDDHTGVQVRIIFKAQTTTN